jgi:AraC-like DNA-binding protein
MASFSISELLFLIVILQCLGVSLFLFVYKKDKRKSNLLLALFFLVLSFNLIDQFLYIHKVYFNYPAFAFWSGSFPLLFGPLLLFYVQSVIDRPVEISSRWIHLVPFAALFTLTELFYLSKDRESQIETLSAIVSRQVPWYFHLVSLVVFVQFMAYIISAHYSILRYRARVSGKFSDYQKQNLAWLSRMLIFFAVLMIVSTLNGFMALTVFANLYFVVLIAIILALFMYLTQTVFHALQQTEFYSFSLEPVDKSIAHLSIQETESIVEKLNHRMEAEKVYLDPELTLDQLSAQINVKPKVLSSVLNDHLKKNFFDYVNFYRVEEAKRLLRENPDAKILGLLMDAGFNSKSSFNALFRKYTGQTPSQFRQKVD